MPGPVPGIHVLAPAKVEDVDGRDEPGHDEGRFCFLSSIVIAGLDPAIQ
jgi:hypothetical protein